MKAKLFWGIIFFVLTSGVSAEEVKLQRNDSATNLTTVKESYKLTGLNLKDLSEKVLYKKTPQEDLYLYILRPQIKPTKPSPAIIYFVGGGWVKGSVEYQLMVSAWWRDQGIIAITADYRVNSRHHTTPLECIADAKSAVRYVRAHAQELGVDPNKIIVGGGSAGGHIASCTFLDGGDEKGEDLSVSTKPNALVLHNPVLGEGFRPDFFKEHPEFSPINNVKSGWPPTILSHGTKDSTVPYSGALTFVKKMKEAGNDVQLITVKDAEHSCDWPVSNPNFLPTLTEMTQFMVRHGFVDGDKVILPRVAQDSLFPSNDYINENSSSVADWCNNHYKEKINDFRTRPMNHSSIVMLGNSITEGGKDWAARLGNPNIVNRAISGDMTNGVLVRIGEICFYHPKAIFLLIGINDLRRGNKDVKYTYSKIFDIVNKIHQMSPSTYVYVQSILPTSEVQKVDSIAEVNNQLKNAAKKYNYNYIDIHTSFATDKDLLKPELTVDGLHLNEAGYDVWCKILSDYIPNENKYVKSLEGVKTSYKLSPENLMNLSEKILYKRTPQEDMYLYLLRPLKKSMKAQPAVIYFCGGGWINGEVEYQIPHAAWWRDQGMIAIAADYRVKNRHATSPLECIADAKSAVRYVRAHAQELGIDPNKIAVAGASAGGHLSLCTLLEGGDEKGEDLNINTKPNLLLLHNPQLGDTVKKEFLRNNKQFAPILHIKTGWPPTIITNGTKDNITPISIAKDFVHKMQLAGNEAQLIADKDAEHSCDWPVSNPNFLPNMTEMTDFMVRHGYVNKDDVTLAPVAQDSLFPPKEYAPDYVIDWSKSHYKERISEFRQQPIPLNSIVMLGNSLTEGGKDWSLRLNNNSVVNRGISGDVTEGVLNRIAEICFYKPKEIFLLIGINDINGGNKRVDETFPKIMSIVEKIHLLSPSTKVYVQSLLPTVHENLKIPISQLNLLLKKNDKKYKYSYIDIHSAFADENDLMKKELTTDGLHLQPSGYDQWTKILSKYIPQSKK